MGANIKIFFREEFERDFDHEIVFFDELQINPTSTERICQAVNNVLKTLNSDFESLNIEIKVRTTQKHKIINKLNKFSSGGNLNMKSKLSLREIEVLDQILKGFTNKEIANNLFISYETVKSHRKNILAKTSMPNTAALANYYHRTFFDEK